MSRYRKLFDLPQGGYLAVEVTGECFIGLTTDIDDQGTDLLPRTERMLSHRQLAEVVRRYAPERFYEIVGHLPTEPHPWIYRVIGGVRYDTATAERVCAYGDDVAQGEPVTEEGWVYRTPDGHWFIVEYEGTDTEPWIIPMPPLAIWTKMKHRAMNQDISHFVEEAAA